MMRHSVGSVSPVLLGVTLLPVGTSGGTGSDGGVTLLTHASGLLAGGGKSTELSVVVLGRDDPVDSGVASDGTVGGIDHDDFKELEGGILSAPVGREDAEVGALTSDTLLGVGSVGSLLLQLADTVVNGLSVNASLVDGALSSSSADSNTIDNITLGSLVAELSGLVGSGGTVALVDDGELSVLPGPDSKDESDKIRLLLSPQLFEIFVGSHSLISI